MNYRFMYCVDIIVVFIIVIDFILNENFFYVFCIKYRGFFFKCKINMNVNYCMFWLGWFRG